MMRRYIDLLTTALLALAAITPAVGLSGCSDSSEPSDLSDDGMVYFTINVSAGAKSSSRAEGEYDFSDTTYAENTDIKYELMNTLRAIIVRPDGTVEHNELLYTAPTGDGFNHYTSSQLKVVGNEKKKIYLIANEDYIFTSNGPLNRLLSNPNAFGIGTKITDGTLEEIIIVTTSGQGQPLVNNSLISNYKTYLPLSEKFEIAIEGLNQDASNRYQSADLFITRAAVKFGFYFDNEKTFKGDIKITDITVNKCLTDREYLLPQTTNGAEATYKPKKYPITNDNRIITEYDCPANVPTFSYTFKPDNFGITYKQTAESEPQLSQSYEPFIYFPESPKQDKYTISLIADFGNDSNGQPIIKEYKDLLLPNLPNLARNTFVKVYISFGEAQPKLEVIVQPYSGVTLEPDFGIDRD